MEHMDPGENQEHNIEDARNIITILYNIFFSKFFDSLRQKKLDILFTERLQIKYKKNIEMVCYQIKEESYQNFVKINFIKYPKYLCSKQSIKYLMICHMCPMILLLISMNNVLIA